VAGRFIAPFRAARDLFPAASVRAAAMLKLSDFRALSARRAGLVSLARRVVTRPAGTAPLTRAIRTFFSFSRLAIFFVTLSSTTAEHASSQVTLTGTRLLFTANSLCGGRGWAMMVV
jgi:hypothetical protein